MRNLLVLVALTCVLASSNLVAQALPSFLTGHWVADETAEHIACDFEFAQRDDGRRYWRPTCLEDGLPLISSPSMTLSGACPQAAPEGGVSALLKPVFGGPTAAVHVLSLEADGRLYLLWLVGAERRVISFYPVRLRPSPGPYSCGGAFW